MIEVRIPQAERVHLMANGLYYSYLEEKGIDLKRCTRIQCKKTGDLILTCPKPEEKVEVPVKKPIKKKKVSKQET